jgi:hypothetical protein
MMHSQRTTALTTRRLSPLALLLVGVISGLAAAGCVTVRPEQRAVLADPTMRFEGEPGEKAAIEHVLENREASFGGGSVRGGGCGCN